MPRSNARWMTAVARGCAGFASTMIHAGRCSADLEAGRRPPTASLRHLGIDPAAIERIRGS